MSGERRTALLPKDERFRFLLGTVLDPEERPCAAPSLVDVRTVTLVEWEETMVVPQFFDWLPPVARVMAVTFFRFDVRLQDGTPALQSPRSTHEEGALAACALGLALAQGLRPEHILLAAAVHDDLARDLSEKADEHHSDLVLHALTVASGAAAVGVESVHLPPRAPIFRSPFAFLAGAARSPSQARADLFAVEAYCAEHGHFGPGGMAHAAGVKLSQGASEEELWALIQSCIQAARMFRPTTRFDFVSYLGAAHGAYCLVAWLLWGVVRWRRAQFVRVTRTVTCEAV